jgi:hypothetical protein
MIMTKSKRIEKKAMKVAKVAEVKENLSAEELMTKARADFAKRYPEPILTLAPTPIKKHVVEPEEVVEEIIDDLNRGEEDDLEIIEIVPVKGKKLISQNSAQAQKLLSKKVAKEVPAPAKKKLADMTKKELAEYYANLSKKATAAKVAKAEAKLAAEGNTDLLEKVPETTPKVVKKATRTVVVTNPLGEKVIPEGMTGSKLKSALKTEKKGNKSAKKVAGTRTTTPLSKMTVAQLEEVKGTISDIQWNKYYKMAGGVSGGTIKVAKPVVVKEETVAPVVKKATRTAAPVAEVKEIKAAPKVNRITPAPFTLADFTLDELIAELKARGCKGSIRVCAEIEL